jgi:hypothetical protein
MNESHHKGLLAHHVRHRVTQVHHRGVRDAMEDMGRYWEITDGFMATMRNMVRD